MSSSAFSESRIKKPNVSGQFYEADPQKLSSHLDQFFHNADTDPYKERVEMVIAPHAGYMYSGQVAAHGFKAVSRHQYKTIVVLAPSHFVGFDGISIWEEGGFETPLGTLEVDSAFAKQLLKAHEKFQFRADAFAREHSLEVELPFLQRTFKDFKIVPVVMGQPDLAALQTFAKSLKAIIGERQDVLIVVSTDLSHYHHDTVAREMDDRTIKAIASLDLEGLIEGQKGGKMEMCGFIPVVTALLYAREKQLPQGEILKYANSGDVTSDKARVVGYSSIVFKGNGAIAGSSEIDPLTNAQKKRLWAIAHDAVKEFVTSGTKINVSESDPRLKQEEGAFVTLIKDGQLRGCIGHVIGRGPLYVTVRDVAIAAASEDPRFDPVAPEEFGQLQIEVSVLSKPRVVKSADEIRLGEHGVILSQGFRSGLFLPEVATQWGFTKEEFLSRLASEKAGLPADAWKSPRTKLEVFTTTKFTLEDIE